ncbi:ABC transporter ATP-binding protein [Methyloraptor flagellatus]|uniref:ABC transporter ATP-binding protein n=1 Tax=Methyloraptor flagellatus TaxID=3162530 RepID=A0AAU7XA19_9HYPH
MVTTAASPPPAAVTGATSGSVSDAAPIVRLSGISKSFSNGTTALAGLDLAIGEGEFVSLLGPSGCGKSTVLRIVAGLTNPTSGRVDWLGAGGSVPAAGTDRPEIGFVFQEPTLMPWATAFQNVHLPLKLKGISAKTARDEIMHALDGVGLAGFANAYPRELSGGMKMRVSIARALVTRPRILLMDEPFAALDEITRFKLNDDIMRLYEAGGWTVIFVTHSVYESVFLSSRIVVMAARPGRVVDDIAVEAPHPRGEDFRTSAYYAATCRRASEALHRAMDARDHL